MSTFWSLWIIVLTVGSIIASWWLIWATGRMRNPDEADEETTGHEWDGIREYNNPMPRWWVNLFYLTIIFSVGYLILYPGLGNFAGVLGWTQEGQYEDEVAEFEERMEPLFSGFREMELTELAEDETALAHGRAVFGNFCATCHGSDARGARGFPNLRDAQWQWGSTPEDILHSIKHGREGVMPGWGDQLGDRGVTETAVYVQQLAGRSADPMLARAGQRHYQQLCASCHGPEGRGMVQLGAPDLTNNLWVYGSSFEAISNAIRNGLHGAMPGHEPIIGEDRSRLVAAYVLSMMEEVPESGSSED